MKEKCPKCGEENPGLFIDANGNSMCGECYKKYGKQRKDQTYPYYPLPDPHPYPYPYPYPIWKWTTADSAGAASVGEVLPKQKHFIC